MSFQKMFVVWRCLFGVLTLLLLSVASASAAVADWSGDWDSTWRDRTARIKLVQSGDDVTGHYRLKSGQIQAKASERVLRGTWTERGRHGSFVAVMAADGKTFTARFGSGEWLTGIRVEADGQFQGQPVDRSSPAMVAHHFLNIMNAIGPGRMELLSEASLFLDFSGVVPSQVSELDYTQALFNVLDAMTFRIWSLQPAPGASDYTEYVAIREDIYLRVLQLIEASGTKLAVPAIVHYNTRDRMPDESIAQEGETQVQEWRKEGRLPFPDFTWQEKAALRESLDYPPEGSVEYAKVKHN